MTIIKKNKKVILISLFLIITLLFLSNISLVRAETVTVQGIFLSGVSDSCYKNGDCNFNDIMGMIVNLAKVILKVVGTAALVMFILGGLLWLTSGGKQQQVAKGKKILTNALIGLFIVFFAWSIIALLGNVLGIESQYRLENIDVPASKILFCDEENIEIADPRFDATCRISVCTNEEIDETIKYPCLNPAEHCCISKE